MPFVPEFRQEQSTTVGVTLFDFLGYRRGNFSAATILCMLEMPCNAFFEASILFHPILVMPNAV